MKLSLGEKRMSLDLVGGNNQGDWYREVCLKIESSGEALSF